MNKWTNTEEDKVELYRAIGRSVSCEGTLRVNTRNKQLLRYMVDETETETKETELMDIQHDIYIHCISNNKMDKYDPKKSKLITYVNRIVNNYLKDIKRDSETFGKPDILCISLDTNDNQDDSSVAQYEISNKNNPEQILIQNEDSVETMGAIESVYDEAELLYLNNEISIDDLSISKNVSVAWTKRVLCKKKNTLKELLCSKQLQV